MLPNLGPWFLVLISAVGLLGGEPEAVHGTTHSLEYPKPYPLDSNGTWNILVPLGFRIKLTFTFLEKESSQSCRYNQVKVTSADKLLGLVCGTKGSVVGNFPGESPISSQTRRLESDFSNEETCRGFQAHYEAVDVDECSGSGHKCDQICHNTIGSYICSCYHGYKLQADEMNCKVIDCGPPKELENGNVCNLAGRAVTTKYPSKIKYSCHKFYSLTTEENVFMCNYTGHWENGALDANSLHCEPICGKPKKSLAEQAGRVFGGKKATAGTIPWQVYVKKGSSRACGILITDQWILSAAHIFRLKGLPLSTPLRPSAYNIYMGENDLMDLRNGSNLPIEAIYVHPGFTNVSHDYDNDIALVKLREPVKLTQHILPICLPPSNLPDLYKPHRLAYVSGWGVTNDNYLFSTLQFAGLPLTDQTTCERSFVGKKMPGGQNPVFTDNMVCAGDGTGQADSCQGDDGGPLATWDRDTGRWYVVGIVSWGVGCAKKGSYGVYTRVSRYLDWLNDMMRHH